VSFDNVCKLLAEKYPADFVRWLIAEESANIKVLKTELSLEPIRADSVTFIQTKNRILHIEFQTLTQSSPAIPFRMLDYSVRLKRQYKCPVVQVVIFLQETNDEIAFTQEYVDDTTVHRYQVIRMWEQDSSLFLNNANLLPLATLSRTDSPQGLLSQVAEKVATISDRETKKILPGIQKF
jgi:predicted transposase YdaD